MKKIASELVKIAKEILAWRDEGQKLRDVEDLRWEEMEEGYDPRHKMEVERNYKRWRRNVEKAFDFEQLKEIKEDELRHLFDSGFSDRDAIEFLRSKF